MRKCLTKDRRRRLQDIGDARIDLEQAIADPSTSYLNLTDRALLATTNRTRTQRVLLACGLVAAFLAGGAVIGFLTPDATPKPLPIRRLTVNLEVEGRLGVSFETATQLSPDGSMIAYLVMPNEGTASSQLYLRQLNELQAELLPAAKDTVQYCFSPDGQWIVFRTNSDSMIRKVSIATGSVVDLCEAGLPQTSLADFLECGLPVAAPNR